MKSREQIEGQPSVWTSRGELMSRSASEPVSASKVYNESGQASIEAEARVRHEAMIKSSGGTLRGVRGRRVSKGTASEPGRPLERPLRKSMGQGRTGTNNREDCSERESERPIVAIEAG